MKRTRFILGARIAKVFVAAILISGTTQGQISTVAGSGGAGYGGDGGLATSGSLNTPTYVAKDAAGNLYIADVNNARIRKVSASGIITTFAGTGTVGYSGDGGAATAANLRSPAGVAIDRSGNLYISDATDYRIRKVSTSGVITTFAGNGSTGFSGDGSAATAAKFSSPYGIAFDTSGNLFVADKGNNRIRKITSAGVISTVAGSGGSGYSGDGAAATAALIKAPINVATDRYGNVYIADQGNNRIRIISASGIINTFAGNGTAGYSGDGAAATAAMLNSPLGLAVDNSGNVYVGDVTNNRVRKIATSGTISTYAGTGSAGYSGDGGAATSAQLYAPSGLAIDNAGSLYIADKTNGRIRKVAGINHAPYFTGGATQSFTVCENASALAINSYMSANDSDAGQTETWSVSAAAVHGTLAGFSATSTSTGGVVTPSGLAYTPTTGYSGMDSFKIQVSDGLTSALTTVIVTTNPLPVAGTISGPSSVCEGAVISLSCTGTGGTWSATNGNANVVAVGAVTGITAGLDTIKYTVTNTCGSIAALYPITVNALPVVPSITGPATVVAGSSVTLANTLAGGTWSSSIAGVATVSTTGVVTGVAAGTTAISYTSTNAAGCMGYTTLSFTVTPYLVVNSIAQAAGLSIYPNPATSNITLAWAYAAGSAAVIITNATGQPVYTGSIDMAKAGRQQVNLSGLATGIYLIKLTTENGSYFEKLQIVK